MLCLEERWCRAGRRSPRRPFRQVDLGGQCLGSTGSDPSPRCWRRTGAPRRWHRRVRSRTRAAPSCAASPAKPVPVPMSSTTSPGFTVRLRASTWGRVRQLVDHHAAVTGNRIVVAKRGMACGPGSGVEVWVEQGGGGVCLDGGPSLPGAPIIAARVVQGTPAACADPTAPGRCAPMRGLVSRIEAGTDVLFRARAGSLRSSVPVPSSTAGSATSARPARPPRAWAPAIAGCVARPRAAWAVMRHRPAGRRRPDTARRRCPAASAGSG